MKITLECNVSYLCTLLSGSVVPGEVAFLAWYSTVYQMITENTRWLVLLPSLECKTCPDLSLKMTVGQEQNHTNKHKGEWPVVVFELSNSLHLVIVLLTQG